MKYQTAVVIGKFYPPHRGHHFLIETAFATSARVHVIVCAKPSDTIPGDLRGDWLREVHPTADVMVIDDRYDEHDSRVWAENTIRWLGHAPEVVFTSEDYGDAYARHMNCAHVQVDKARARVPCSGTMIRRDPYAQWQFLAPPVRGWFSKRVCVLGAESTGTTTLAEDLAATLQTCWVAEYGREYSAMKHARGETTWQTSEFVDIAREQSRRENEQAKQANRILICDTNAFATTFWHRRYMASRSSTVEAIAAAGKCDLYLLTGDEIPFVQDGLRDGEDIRHEMHRWFETALANQPVPWRMVSGSRQERIEISLRAIASLFADSQWQPGKQRFMS
ncbi:AAA family ATPase [Anatilimnocola sp. NA78]|uniref:AAA family ATPase n=1 Tax=Anatilimnocola sp. NA78 TaxID=3415683 RepID=UPI003CE50A4B